MKDLHQPCPLNSRLAWAAVLNSSCTQGAFCSRYLKGAVPDDIHPQIVRWLADFLAEPLFKLFDSSDSGTYRLALGHYMFNT